MGLVLYDASGSQGVIVYVVFALGQLNTARELLQPPI